MRLVSISRAEFIRRMLKLGFDGPYAGGKHEFLILKTQCLIIPNPHQGEISVDLLSRLLRQANVSRQEWEKAAK